MFLIKEIVALFYWILRKVDRLWSLTMGKTMRMHSLKICLAMCLVLSIRFEPNGTELEMQYFSVFHFFWNAIVLALLFMGFQKRMVLYVFPWLALAAIEVVLIFNATYAFIGYFQYIHLVSIGAWLFAILIITVFILKLIGMLYITYFAIKLWSFDNFLKEMYRRDILTP